MANTGLFNDGEGILPTPPVEQDTAPAPDNTGLLADGSALVSPESAEDTDIETITGPMNTGLHGDSSTAKPSLETSSTDAEGSTIGENTGLLNEGGATSIFGAPIQPVSLGELTDVETDNPLPGNGYSLIFMDGVWKPIHSRTLVSFIDSANSGNTLGVDFTEDTTNGVENITATVDASSLPLGTTNSFTDTPNNGTTLGVDFSDLGGDVSATIDASDIPHTFTDTVNSGSTLGVDFTDTAGVVTATVDASSIGGGSSNTFNDTTGHGGVDFTDTAGTITATFDLPWIVLWAGKTTFTKLTDTVTEITYSFSFDGTTYFRKKLKSGFEDKIYSDSGFTTELASRY